MLKLFLNLKVCLIGECSIGESYSLMFFAKCSILYFVRKTPQKVEFGDKVKIIKARCGVDGTMFLTDTGTLYACGK